MKARMNGPIRNIGAKSIGEIWLSVLIFRIFSQAEIETETPIQSIFQKSNKTFWNKKYF